MAVTMEVSSRRGPPELLGSPVPKKRAWGADAQQLMQLMMNQLQHSPSETSELTLDLLGNADPAASSPSSQHQLSPEFLHLDTLPLPSGWEKCLDLQTGELYFVNKGLGVSSFNDPRKWQRTRSRDFYNSNCRQPVEIELQTAAVLQQQQQGETPEVAHPQVAHPQVAHEFLASKKSETESLNLKGGQGAAVATPAGCSTSSSSGSPPLRRRSGSRIRTALPSSSSKQQQQQQHQHQHHWSLQQHRINYTSTTTTSSRGAIPVAEDSNLELDLNLSAGGGMPRRSSSPRTSPQAVCTVEMIQNALRRSSEKPLTVKREAAIIVAPGGLGSSSFSSLTNSTTRSEPSAASPATSNSSSASSRSGAGLKTPASAGVFEAESIKVERVTEPGALVMGACTRCLMYVMLHKADPRCPRCDGKVPVDDFAPPCKKQQRGGLNLGLGSN